MQVFPESHDGYPGYVLPSAAVAFGWICPDADMRVLGVSALSTGSWAAKSYRFPEATQFTFESIGADV